MRSAVRLKARVAGMGRESACEVIAIKSSSAETGETTYSHCHLITAPDDWPDGRYIVSIDGHSVPATRQGGLWLAPEEPDPAYIPTRYSAAD